MPSSLLAQSGQQMVASGTVSDANMTITLTAGSADIDFTSATIPRDYKGHKLIIYDSAMQAVIGFVYTNGAGTVQNIVSAKGGSTRNWTYQHASFDTTDAYTYQIFKIWDAPVVTSGSVAAADSHLDTTTANAFAWLNGVDLSAFQDGRHMLGVYDSSGRGRLGFISSSAPAGETLSTVINDDCSADNTAGWTISGVSAVLAFDTDHYTYGTTAAGGWWIYSPVAARTIGSLLKFSVDLKDGTASSVTISVRIGDNVADYNSQSIVTTAEFITSSTYGTAKSGGNGNWKGFLDINANLGGTNIQAKNVLGQVVTDPPSTAVKILATKGGARGWTDADAAFDPNTASTYKVTFIGD